MAVSDCCRLVFAFTVGLFLCSVAATDSVYFINAEVCKKYKYQPIVQDTTFHWLGKVGGVSRCELHFKKPSEMIRQICVDVDGTLSCRTTIRLESEQDSKLMDCSVKSKRLCSDGTLSVYIRGTPQRNVLETFAILFTVHSDHVRLDDDEMVSIHEVSRTSYDDFEIRSTTVQSTAMSIAVMIVIIIAVIVGTIIVIVLIVCCCCCKGRRTGGHIYQQPRTTTTTTVITQQHRPPPQQQYPPQVPAGYPGYQSSAQMAPPHQGMAPTYPPQAAPQGYPQPAMSPAYPPQGASPGYPPQRQDNKVEPTAPPAQDMPYYPPPQGQPYPPPQPHGAMVQPPPYSEK